jgi:alpha-1,2-mannosyltransferase
LILLGLLTVAWLGIRRGDSGGERNAGIAIGIAAVIKVFPGLIVLWFLLIGRPRAAAWAVLAGIAVVAVTLPITGLGPWLDYPTALLNLSYTPQAIDALAPTAWLAPYLGFTLARALVTGVGVVLLVSTARRGSLPVSFSLAILLSVLVTPALYTSYLAVLVLPLLLALGAGIRVRWLALAYFLMWGGQQAALGDLAWVVTKGLPTAGALLLLGLFVARASEPRTRSNQVSAAVG